jgi:hypothetical protein
LQKPTKAFVKLSGAGFVGSTHTLPAMESEREGISGRVKFLPLAWAGMPKTSFRKNSDSPLKSPLKIELNGGRMKKKSEGFYRPSLP